MNRLFIAGRQKPGFQPDFAVSLKFYITTSRRDNSIGIILYPDMGGESLEEIIKVVEEPLPPKKESQNVALGYQ